MWRGKEYGYGAESEKADFSVQEEHFRIVLITFYNVRNIGKDFKYDFGDLDILGTEVSADRFTFESYIDHNEPNPLSFESDGFDMAYLQDKLAK